MFETLNSLFSTCMNLSFQISLVLCNIFMEYLVRVHTGVLVDVFSYNFPVFESYSWNYSTINTLLSMCLSYNMSFHISFGIQIIFWNIWHIQCNRGYISFTIVKVSLCRFIFPLVLNLISL